MRYNTLYIIITVILFLGFTVNIICMLTIKPTIFFFGKSIYLYIHICLMGICSISMFFGKKHLRNNTNPNKKYFLKMKTMTKYYIRYKTRAGRVNPFNPVIKSTTYTITCQNKKEALNQGNVMNYDNVKYLRIFSKTYINLFSIHIPVKKTILFSGNIK